MKVGTKMRNLDVLSAFLVSISQIYKKFKVQIAYVEKFISNLYCYEKYFFCLIVLINLYPICSGKFFPTLDGPSHLYNSQLINATLFQNNDVINNVFALNPVLVPNWSGHLLLAFFMCFLPAYMAEKLLLMIYLIALPFAYRFLIQKVSQKNIHFSYFAFPLSYSSLFCMGFYNFSIAIVFALFTLFYWLKHQDNYHSIKSNLVLFFLMFCCYFSHVFLFIIVIFFIGFYLIIEAIVNLITNKNNPKQTLLFILLKVRNLFFLSLFQIVLTINFFLTQPIKEIYTPIEISKLTDGLFILWPIISFSWSYEEQFTQKIVYLLVFLIIVSIYQYVKRFRFQKDVKFVEKFKIGFSKKIISSLVWLLFTMVLLLMYFVIPDSANAGLVSIRIALMFFFFLIVWLSTQTYNRWILNCALCVVLFCHFNLNNYYFEVSNQLNELAEECYVVSEHIEVGSVVLPINNLHDLWLTGHYYGYFGANKPIILLENYECTLGFFPIVWNFDQMPNYVIPDFKQSEGNCANWKSDTLKKPTPIKFVMLMGKFEIETDSCKKRLKRVLDKNYYLQYKSKNLQLFRLKNNILDELR